MTAPARIAAACGAVAWLGALAGRYLDVDGIVLAGGLALASAVLVGVGRLPPTAIVVCVVAVGAAVSGHLASAREEATLGAAIPTGRVELTGVAADVPVRIRDEVWVVVADGRAATSGHRFPPIAVVWPEAPYPEPGDGVAVAGRLDEYRRHVRSDPVGGKLTAVQAAIVSRPQAPLHRLASGMRSRVVEVLRTDTSGQAEALLAGFLIGETSGLSSEAVDDLRAAGLSHFVAVSGSNVALFLAAWWLLLAPLAGPRVRAGLGLIGVALFSLVTRWEPSVLRASAMIGFVLLGRLAGVPIEPIVALGWGVTVLLLVAGQLAASVGFQLSVAATIGVMVGVRLVGPRRPRPIWSILGATVGAQVAVAPIALVHFGSIPLMAPLANLIAAPIVTAATGLGGAAVLLGGGGMLTIARFPATAVLWLAARFASWPQLDAVALLGVIAIGACLRLRATRKGAIAAVVSSVAVAFVPPASVDGPRLVALDVGQGDALLVRDVHTVLVDGGADPAVLADALDRRRVRHVDLLVVTHGDADHAGGLIGITSRVSVRELWIPAFGDHGDLLRRLVAECRNRGVAVSEIAAGVGRTLGEMHITALGPQRRYKRDNDGSIVLWVDLGGHTILLPGDIEAVAQRELPQIRPDILVVPHHGAATSDLDWLAETVGRLAIISVGPNRYGHPQEEVVEALRNSGARVLSTAEVGDVIVPLP
ncbi:MAG: ComEC/Rec2 family competence protein [Acidimicrobiia bacterium]|nr:ComEC/Rec2 family competence protein [Acidimicrobiia bacterium]